MSAKLDLEGNGEVELRSPLHDELKNPSEEEILACRPCRIILVVFFSLGLLAMLVAAIVVIATTAGCTKTVVPLKPFWKKEMAYQIYVHSFQDTNGDGYGDLKGIAQRLGYLKGVGAQTLILSGLLGKNFRDLNVQSGSKTDMVNLIAKAKSEKMSIVIEMDPTYTASDTQWFIDSSSSNASRYRNWYIWRKQANTWTNKAGGLAWELDTTTNYYYYYYIDNKKPALNYRNPEVQAELKGSMDYWLKLGVKGFKLNHVQRLVVDGQFRDNVGSIVYDKDLPETHAMLQDFNALVKVYGAVLIGSFSSTGNVTSYYGTQDKRELDLVLNNKLTQTPSGGAFGTFLNTTIANNQRAVPETFAWPGWIFDGPQYQRLGSRYSDPRVSKLMNLCLLTLPGTPVFYYGDELLLKNYMVKSTTAMAWDSTVNGGFSKVNPWYIKSTPMTLGKNVKNQEGKKDVFDLFKTTSLLKQKEVSLQNQIMKVLFASADSIVYHRYEAGSKGFLVALNFGKTKIQATTNLAKTVSGAVAVDSLFTHVNRKINLATFNLEPFQGLIIRINQ